MAKPKRIALREAAALLASFLYPTDTRREANLKARQLIRYAVRTHRLTPLSDGSFQRDEFLWWADGKWPEFRRTAEIPARPLTPVQADLHIRGHSPLVIVLPSDVDGLRRRCMEEIRLRRRCEEDLENTHRELEILRAWKAEKESKNQRYREGQSAKGKLGGRGRRM